MSYSKTTNIHGAKVTADRAHSTFWINANFGHQEVTYFLTRLELMELHETIGRILKQERDSKKDE